MGLPETFKLNSGAEIPAIGFGTWQSKPHEVEKAVEIALRNGYKHIDGAAIYQNEPEVGAGLRNSGVDRKNVFLTSKLWNHCHRAEDVEPALDKTLKDLQVDYLDLYLIHWPGAFAKGDKFFPIDKDGVFQLEDTPATETWKAMEKVLKTGKTKAIGVSNFNIRRLKELLEVAEVVPAVNQIEAHPYIQQKELTDFCTSKGILVQAYSPLGNNETGVPRTIDDPLVHEIAKELDMDAGQVLVSWALQRGTNVLPKSVTEKRIISNVKVKELPQQAYERLNGMEKHGRYNEPSGRWGYDIFDEYGAENAKQKAKDLGAENLKKFHN